MVSDEIDYTVDHGSKSKLASCFKNDPEIRLLSRQKGPSVNQKVNLGLKFGARILDKASNRRKIITQRFAFWFAPRSSS